MRVLWAWSIVAEAEPVALDDVLAAVDARVPELAAAAAKLDQAEAKLLAARGAFDPAVVGKLGAYAGKDPREVASVSVIAPSALGPTVELGWSVGQGDFPVYDLDRETLPGGELRVRGVLPVLDGLGLPAERASWLVARAGAAFADADLDAKRVEVRRKATESYWKWVAAGAKLRIDRALLAQTEARTGALRREVEEGTRARIDLLDNERAVLQRRDAVERSAWQLDAAALALSLWYRDRDGLPIVLPADAMPDRLDPEARTLPPGDEDRAAAVARPDVAALDALLEAARAERARSGNAAMPTLDLVGEAIRPVDPAGKPELYAGAELKLPTLARKERGTWQAAGAAVAALDQARRAAMDAARAEVDATRLAVEAAGRRVGWTEQAQALAAEVVELERRRFEVGGGDLFQLLAREGTLASAQKDAIDAALDQELALAARSAAIGAGSTEE